MRLTTRQLYEHRLWITWLAAAAIGLGLVAAFGIWQDRAYAHITRDPSAEVVRWLRTGVKP